MFAEEFKLASHESSGLMDNYDDDDASAGRLSFCDLHLSVNLCDWDPNSKEAYNNKSACDEDLFEFITTKHNLFTDYAKDNIVFCGKLIPYKTPQLPDSNNQNKTTSKSKNRAGDEDDHVLANSGGVKSRSRWYMRAFGMRRRFQMDIKARQRRRNNSMAAPHHHVDQMTVKSSDDKKRGKGALWLRLLACKGLHQTTILNSSTACLPQL